MAGPVGALDLARWQDLQQEIRHLTLQRGMRFVAAAVLAPFGLSGVGNDADRSGPAVSALAFGIALLVLAVAELATMIEAGIHVKERQVMEKTHPALAPKGKRGRFARLLTVASGPGFSTILYALLGGVFLVASVL